jgi:hypothetical protein
MPECCPRHSSSPCLGLALFVGLWFACNRQWAVFSRMRIARSVRRRGPGGRGAARPGSKLDEGVPQGGGVSPLRYGRGAPAIGSAARTARGSTPMAGPTSTSQPQPRDRRLPDGARSRQERTAVGERYPGVRGALGVFIHSDFDYDAINRLFSFEGGQVGGYATYLRSGLFVDTMSISWRSRPCHHGGCEDRLRYRFGSCGGASSSRWPPFRSTGPTSTASASAATGSPSMTIPM